MKVLVACEYSGTVREAFKAQGHYAVSCDLLDTDIPGNHIVGNVLDILNDGWDLMIAHPPCTALTVAGNRWYHDKPELIQDAVAFVRLLADAPIPSIAIENPIGRLSTLWRKPDQIIQPWMFGHEATKSTCLWLTNLPCLQPTNVVGRGERHVTKSGKSLPEWYNLPPSADRWKIRSKTFEGIAEAMAIQWSKN